VLVVTWLLSTLAVVEDKPERLLALYRAPEAVEYIGHQRLALSGV